MPSLNKMHPNCKEITVVELTWQELLNFVRWPYQVSFYQSNMKVFIYQSQLWH